MKFKAIVEYEYPIEHKPPVKAEIVLHGDRVVTDNIKPMEQKTGHWTNGDDKCPCCGKSKFEGLDADIWADWQPKFCPNCGVRMIEPQKSDGEE